MKSLAGLCAAGALAGGVLVWGQQLPEPRKQFGASITASFEGWYYNADGTRSFLVGYYNRNSQQEIDVPIGPNNRIEPGGPDLGQPTHFLTGRQMGMFTVPVPKDFKPKDQYTWTLVANGQTTSIPLRLNPDYVVNALTEIAVHNTPPVIRFAQDGLALQGPIASLATAAVRTASVSAPLALTLWATDDMKYTSGTSAPPNAQRQALTIRWTKYRGAGAVTFDKPRPEVEKLEKASAGESAAFSGKATANVTFSEPGDYVLHVTANDYSGDGGTAAAAFGCCWTNALVKITVKP